MPPHHRTGHAIDTALAAGAWWLLERLRHGLGGVLREAGGRVQAAGSSLRMEVEAVLQALRLIRTEGPQLGEVVMASDAKSLIEALVRCSRGDPMTGIVLLEHPALLRELECWPDWPVRWVWVRSHSGNVHHNHVDQIAYRMASRRW